MPDDTSKKKTFEEFMAWLKDAVEDIATLQVATLTGTVKLTDVTSGADNKLDLDKLFEKVMIVNGSSEIRLLAFSRFSIDSDVVQFVSAGLQAGEMPLIEAHNAVVRSAQAGRQAVLEMCLSLLPGRAGK